MITAELKKARELLATCGWVGPMVEPYCIAADGMECWEWDEGVRSFSVHGALVEARAWPDGMALLRTVVAPAHAALDRLTTGRGDANVTQLREFQRLCRLAMGELDLAAWLKQRDRTKEQVLHAFVLAIARSKRQGERA